MSLSEHDVDTLIDAPLNEENDENSFTKMTIIEHLAELRKRLFFSLIAVILFSILGFVFYQPILRFLLMPLPAEANILTQHSNQPKLVVTGIGEGFSVVLKLSFAVGIALAAPVWLWQVWGFLAPAMTKKERKYALPFTLIGTILFIVGLTVGFVTLRFPINWLVTFGQNTFIELISADSYFSFVGFFLLAFGIVFELPLVLTFLAVLGIINSRMLAKNRSYILIGLWFLSTVITPGSDPYSPIILSVAFTFLFFVSEFMIRFIKK